MTRPPRAFRFDGIGLPIALAAGALLVGGLAWTTGALDLLEDLTWDLRVRQMAARETPDPRIVVVGLDKALARATETQFPLPRALVAEIVGRIQSGRPRVIGLDLLLDERNRDRPEDDAALGEALAAGSPAVLGVRLRPGAPLVGAEASMADSRFRLAPLPAAAMARLEPRRFSGANLPVPEILTGATALGAVNVARADSATDALRDIPLLFRLGPRIVPGLGLAMVLAAGEIESVGCDPGGRLLVGSRPVAVNRRGEMRLRYRGPPGTHRTISAAAFLDPDFDPGQFRDAIVLVGIRDDEQDLSQSPLTKRHPGVEIQATAIDNLLRGDAFRPAPPLPLAGVWFLTALLLALVGARFAGGPAMALLLLSALAIPWGAGLLAYRLGHWWPVVPHLAIGLVTLGGTLVGNYSRENRLKRRLRSTFDKYVSPPVIESLLRDPSGVRLGGETREISVLFCDLAGFTRLSEGLDPQEVVGFLNEYLTLLSGVILDERGTLDKFEGDAVMAFWNAPLAQPDHARLSRRAAVAILEAVASRGDRLAARLGLETLRVRVGVATGPAVVGNMGSSSRLAYTAIGDTVNVASRLEGANKFFGTDILTTAPGPPEEAGALLMRPVGRVRVVGRRMPLETWELAWRADRRAAIERFRQGYELLTNGRASEAREIFAGLGDDPVAARFRDRLDRARAGGEAWDGLWELDQK